jgi:hypothetical protein
MPQEIQKKDIMNYPIKADSPLCCSSAQLAHIDAQSVSGSAVLGGIPGAEHVAIAGGDNGGAVVERVSAIT